MNTWTWLTSNKTDATEEISPNNIIELMKLNGFDFYYTHDSLNYFKRDNMEGFVTTRLDGEDSIAMFIKGIKYSVLFPISNITRFFVSKRAKSDAVNVYVDFLKYTQTFSTK